MILILPNGSLCDLKYDNLNVEYVKNITRLFIDPNCIVGPILNCDDIESGSKYYALCFNSSSNINPSLDDINYLNLSINSFVQTLLKKINYPAYNITLIRGPCVIIKVLNKNIVEMDQNDKDYFIKTILTESKDYEKLKLNIPVCKTDDLETVLGLNSDNSSVGYLYSFFKNMMCL